MLQPNKCSGSRWLSRIPKRLKMGERVKTELGSDFVGWGIHIFIGSKAAISVGIGLYILTVGWICAMLCALPLYKGIAFATIPGSVQAQVTTIIVPRQSIPPPTAVKTFLYLTGVGGCSATPTITLPAAYKSEPGTWVCFEGTCIAENCRSFNSYIGECFYEL
jgi:hypothetical protein